MSFWGFFLLFGVLYLFLLMGQRSYRRHIGPKEITIHVVEAGGFYTLQGKECRHYKLGGIQVSLFSEDFGLEAFQFFEALVNTRDIGFSEIEGERNAVNLRIKKDGKVFDVASCMLLAGWAYATIENQNEEYLRLEQVAQYNKVGMHTNVTHIYSSNM